MGRPRKMEADEVLEKVVDLFWKNGFRATSMKEICDGCDMNPGSLYEMFGDKQGLFSQTLQYYRKKYTLPRLACLRDDRPLSEKMQNLFQDLVTGSLEDTHARGCFIVNTTLELAHDDADMKEFVLASAEEMENAFLVAFRKAQATGELAEDKDALELARFFVATIYGLRVRARLSPGKESLESIARVALMALK